MRQMLFALALGLAASGAAQAETLTFAIRTPPASIDPQLTGLVANVGYVTNIFSTLFGQDPVTLGATPNLAIGANRTDDLTWMIDLREDVTFHNGDRFTAADVIFSWKRLQNVPNSDGLQLSYLMPIKTMEAVDDHTLRITTADSTPDLPERLNKFVIICSCVEGATTEDFNSGKAAIGTGPYKLVTWRRGEAIERGLCRIFRRGSGIRQGCIAGHAERCVADRRFARG